MSALSLTNPVATAKNTVMFLGVTVVVSWMNSAANWFGSLMPSAATTRKVDDFATDKLANMTRNGTLSSEYQEVDGLLSAFWKCPWPFTSGSSACYGLGWRASPLGQSTVGQTAEFGFKAASLAGTAGFCAATENGFLNKAACVLNLDGKGRQDLEDKIDLAKIYVLLGLIWYATRPKEEERKKI